MQRPTGITILAIAAAVGGVLWIFGSFGLLAFGAAFWGLLALITGAADLGFAYGAWFLKPWGWLLGIGTQAASILLAFINFIRGTYFLDFLISVLISGAIIYYLNTPEIKRVFGRP